LELPVRSQRGDVVDTAEVSDDLFGVEMNRTLVHQAMVMYGLNRRQGTHATKTRAQVSGGGRKPWPQKYTGRSRQGSIRAPQWRHGGVVFGPHPRDHRRDMPKKMRRRALRCVLSDKVRADKLILVDDLAIDGPSTKGMSDILSSLGAGRSTLIVTDGTATNVVLSARNLEKVWTTPVNLLNAEQLLRRDRVVMTVDAARRAEQLWAGDHPRRPRRGHAAPADASTDDGAKGAGE
jgi:large subunit ribosomal protein L4